MREIEIKARVRDKQATLQAIKDLGIILGEAKKQHDVVYGPPGENGIDDNKSNWLRIRTEDDARHIFTLKRSVTSQLDSIEHETVIEDAQEMAKIIEHLGYELFSDLTKIRRKAQFGEIEICYDELPELGTYIEAEKLCPDDVNVELIRNELWVLLEKLGISKEDEETNGYDVLQKLRDQEPAKPLPA